MNKCLIDDDIIESYLFNRMTDDEETTFQQHLMTCVKCSGKVQQMRRLAGAFHPETIAREEVGKKHEPVRNVSLMRRFRPWLIAASFILLFAAGWLVGRYETPRESPWASEPVQPQIEDAPEYASEGSAPVTASKSFALISPGEGNYLFSINEAYADENNIMFKWSPRASNALLVIKSNDGGWDEIRVKDTDHIKVNLTKYSSCRSLTWFLIVSESEEVMKGSINLKKYLPPYVIE